MKRKPYIIFIAATALVLGCQSNEDYDNRQAKNYLDVSIQGITSSNWGTKTRAAASNIVPPDTLWLNDSIYVEAVAEDIVVEKAPTTRATPVTNAKQLETVSIVMFNTGSAQWSDTSSQESGKSPISAINTDGSYVIGTPYTWLEEDPNYRTLIAMSPKHNSDGFTLSTNGQTLDVTVPNDVAKQYDLCVSDMSLNKNIQYTIGSNSNQQKFEMAHMMTAVGFEAAGYDLMLTSVKFIGVNSKNTLTLHNRTWGTSNTPITFEAKINADWLNSEHIQTSNPWRNITPNDGYLMMLPQSHTDDMKLEFTFTGQNGQPGGTYTMLLKDIKADGAATSDWKQGVKITYRLRLKTRPAVRNDNLSILNNMAGSTTSILNIITSTDDDLTFSWTASWLGMYRGTNSTISNPESNGFFTPFATGVNNWANVKFFARNENKSTIANRTATITVWGKKSGVRTFTVTQAKKVLGPQPDEYVQIGDYYWAKGNLVKESDNKCKIGNPMDNGLHFHFGSLVGWMGGTNGDGRGHGNKTPWETCVLPVGYSGSTYRVAGHFKDVKVTNFGYVLPAVDNASTGVGDPCRYYLGGAWRTPTFTQWNLFSNVKQELVTNGGIPGFWLRATPGATEAVFLSAGGYRDRFGGGYYAFGYSNRLRTSSTDRAALHILYANNNNGGGLHYGPPDDGYAVRCVSPVPKP